MTAEILVLYPGAGSTRPLKGLYLEERLHEQGSAQSPFVYGSFVASLDGRIALDEPRSERRNALEGLTSPNDFRLFQELQAQADCLITHGGYLRSLAEGRLGNVLQINAGGQEPDLIAWRKQNGLPAQPAIVIASGSLDFPIHPSLERHGQPLYVATGRSADPARVESLRERGLPVLVAGEGAMVEGAPLVRALGELGYRSLYLLAGPKMLETMLRDRQLSRLYLTFGHRLLGGQRFHSLIEGPPLGDAGRLALGSLYSDPGVHQGDGQWFARFDCAR
jgi:riboflavin biosynthesis pyrimidine reductase